MQINNNCANSQNPLAVTVVFTTKENLENVIAKYCDSMPNLQNIVNVNNFTADYKQKLELTGLVGKRFIVVGLGEANKLDTALANVVGGFASSVVAKENEVDLEVFFAQNTEVNNAMALEIVTGFNIKAYGFDVHVTNQKQHTTHQTNIINLINAEINIEELNAVVSGVNFAKNLVNQPANVATPHYVVEEIKKLQSLGVKVTVLSKPELARKNMDMFLSVGKGSDTESYVVVMEYNNNPEQHKPLAIVGKGVTFDSGGYSLKPAGGMIDMKKDMSGAAATIGLMATLAVRKAKVNVVGVVGLVENLVNGSAIKPGDIVKAMNGKTVEILNTDAEGRLVLGDLLHMCSTEYQPQEMINVATLTGAIIASLGTERAGLFTNNGNLGAKLLSAGEEVGELLWNMPMGKEYEKHLKSSVADLQNITTAPKVAGSIFAAMFLKEFVNDVPWAHLDIAGVAGIMGGNNADLHQKGSPAFGVRLLNTFVKRYYENN